jgi:putative sterol carrier protein
MIKLVTAVAMDQIFRISTPEELASIIKGKNDAELDAMVSSIGVDTVLEQAFAYVVSRFRSTRLNGADPVILEWRLITTHRLRVFQVTVGPLHCTVCVDAINARPTVVFTARLTTFLRLISGEMNGVTATSQGKLTIAGDQSVALRQHSWFDFDQHKTVPRIENARELARLLEGRSNEEIDAGIAAIGVDCALDQLFSGLAQRFLPGRGPRKRTTARLIIKTAEGSRTYHVTAERTRMSYSRESVSTADFVLTAELADLLRMGAGKLDAIKAFTCGKIKIGGNFFLAATFPRWFDFSR